QLRGVPAILAAAAFGGVFLLAVLPHAAVLLTSVTATGSWYREFLPSHLTLGHYRAALVDELAFPSIVNSLRYAAVATLAAAGAGALLAFAFAMLEVSDSLVLAQRSKYYPITKAILDLWQRLGDGPYIASALGVWAMLLLTLTVLAANALLGRKMGAIFRV